MITVTNNQGD